jgi:hypothetical protein
VSDQTRAKTVIVSVGGGKGDVMFASVIPRSNVPPPCENERGELALVTVGSNKLQMNKTRRNRNAFVSNSHNIASRPAKAACPARPCSVLRSSATPRVRNDGWDAASLGWAVFLTHVQLRRFSDPWDRSLNLESSFVWRAFSVPGLSCNSCRSRRSNYFSRTAATVCPKHCGTHHSKIHG